MARETAEIRTPHLPSLYWHLDDVTAPLQSRDYDRQTGASAPRIDIGSDIPVGTATIAAELGDSRIGLAASWAWLLRQVATDHHYRVLPTASDNSEAVSNDLAPSGSIAATLSQAPETPVAASDPVPFPTVHKNTAQAAQQITRDNFKWGGALGQAAGPISFGFRVSGATYPISGHNVSDFSPLTGAQQAAARAALSFWSDVAGITFSDLGNTNNATILFQNYSDRLDGAAAFAFYPAPGATAPDNSAGDVFINAASESTSNVGAGTYEWATFIHEIGHALGLEHPGNYSAAPFRPITYAADAEYIEDSYQYTVMSYFRETNTGADYGNLHPTTPMLHDIAAIQRLYGVNNNTRVGNDVYGFNSNLAGSVYAIASSSQRIVFAVWDGNGTDTFDFSGYTQSQVIDLRPEHFSSVGGLVSNVAVAAGAKIENALGGGGNDFILADSSSGAIGSLTGGGGNDTFRSTQAGLNLYTITDINPGDRINFTDATLAGFSFTFDGTTLNYGTSLRLTLSNHPAGTFVASANPAGGIDLSLSVHLFLIDAGNFDGVGRSDLALTGGGGVAIWINQGSGFAQADVPNASMGAEWTATSAGDFDGDGRSDILWRRAAGDTAIWLMNGTNLRQAGSPAGSMGAEWRVAGVGDFGGDRKVDIAWGNSSGEAAIWSMDGITLGGFGLSNGKMGAEWSISIAGDFNGDAKHDLLWVSQTGDVTDWLMNGSDLVGLNNVGNMGVAWRAVGSGNFNGDGVSDIVWVDAGNNVQIWNMDSGRISQFVSPSGRNGLEWHLREVADFTGDGRADLLWLTDNGDAQVWSVNGTEIAVSAMITPGGPVSAAELGAQNAATAGAAASGPTQFNDVASAMTAAAAPIVSSGVSDGSTAPSSDPSGTLYGLSAGAVASESAFGQNGHII